MTRFLKSSDIMIFGGLLLVAIAFRGPAIAAEIRSALFAEEPTAAVASTKPSTSPAAAPSTTNASVEEVPSFAQADSPSDFFGRPAPAFRVGHRCGH